MARMSPWVAATAFLLATPAYAQNVWPLPPCERYCPEAGARADAAPPPDTRLVTIARRPGASAAALSSSQYYSVHIQSPAIRSAEPLRRMGALSNETSYLMLSLMFLRGENGMVIPNSSIVATVRPYEFIKKDTVLEPSDRDPINLRFLIRGDVQTLQIEHISSTTTERGPLFKAMAFLFELANPLNSLLNLGASSVIARFAQQKAGLTNVADQLAPIGSASRTRFDTIALRVGNFEVKTPYGSTRITIAPLASLSEAYGQAAFQRQLQNALDGIATAFRGSAAPNCPSTIQGLFDAYGADPTRNWSFIAGYVARNYFPREPAKQLECLGAALVAREDVKFTLANATYRTPADGREITLESIAAFLGRGENTQSWLRTRLELLQTGALLRAFVGAAPDGRAGMRERLEARFSENVRIDNTSAHPGLPFTTVARGALVDALMAGRLGVLGCVAPVVDKPGFVASGLLLPQQPSAGKDAFAISDATPVFIAVASNQISRIETSPDPELVTAHLGKHCLTGAPPMTDGQASRAQPRP